MRRGLTVLDRGYRVLQNGSNDDGSELPPPADDLLTCATCASAVDVLVERAYKETQLQAQGYHALIMQEQHSAAAGSGKDGDDDEDGEDEDEDEDGEATVPRRSELELDVLQNLDDVAAARLAVRQEVERELELLRAAEAEALLVAQALRDALALADTAARELNTLSHVAGGAAAGNAPARMLFVVSPEAPLPPPSSSSSSTTTRPPLPPRIDHLNGMRLALRPLPPHHLNWAEINVAWGVASSALCCVRNLHGLPATAAVAATGAPHNLVWTVGLRPLRHRALVRRTCVRMRSSGTGGGGGVEDDAIDVVEDETLSLAGAHTDSATDTTTMYRRAVAAFAAYLLATARATGRFHAMPDELAAADWHAMLSSGGCEDEVAECIGAALCALLEA